MSGNLPFPCYSRLKTSTAWTYITCLNKQYLGDSSVCRVTWWGVLTSGSHGVNWRLSYLSELVRASLMCLSVLEQHVEQNFAEYTDMIFLYGKARGNGRAARRLYQDRFPQRPTPSHTLFAVIPQRLWKRGTVTASRNNCGVPSRRRNPEWEEALGTMCATNLLVATSNRTCSRSEC